MSIRQHDLAERLASCQQETLRVVLGGAEMRAKEDDSSEAMGRRIASAIWWRTHTPVGKIAMADDLAGIIRRIARRAKVELPESSDDLELLEALTTALVPGDTLDPDDLDPELMKRLRASHWAEWMGVGTAGTAVGSKVAAATYLRWTAPVVDWLPYVPKVGPFLVGARKVSKTVVKIAPPIGIGVSLLTLNSVLGADFDRALPLLLGTGLALREKGEATEPPPEEASEIDDIDDIDIIDAEHEVIDVDEVATEE